MLSIEILLKNYVEWCVQTFKNQDFRKFENSAPSKIGTHWKISILKWNGHSSNIQEWLNPSSILIFQGASTGKGLWFFKVVPLWLFQKSSETRVLLSFLTFYIALLIESTMKNYVEWWVQTFKTWDFRRFEKSAPAKIEELVEKSICSNEMVICPTSKSD